MGSSSMESTEEKPWKVVDGEELEMTEVEAEEGEGEGGGDGRCCLGERDPRSEEWRAAEGL